jgi:hypothetical protein
MDVTKCQCGCDESVKERDLGNIDKIKPPSKKKIDQKKMFVYNKNNNKNNNKKKIKSNY